MDVYSGNDDQTAAFLALGGKGVISVAANVIPYEMHLMATDTERSAELQIYYLDLIKTLFSEINPIPVKAAVEMLFRKKQTLRLPLTQLTEPNRRRLKQLLKQYGILKYTNKHKIIKKQIPPLPGIPTGAESIIFMSEER